MQVALGGTERRSLTYKLAAQPGATINLVPALQAAGHDLGTAVDRCGVCMWSVVESTVPLVLAGVAGLTLGGEWDAGLTPPCTPAVEEQRRLCCLRVCRYPQPITYQQLMARFDASHRTANPPAQPAGAAAAAAAAAAAGAGGAAPGGRAAGAAARQGAAPVAAAAAAAAESAAGEQQRPPKRARAQSPPVRVKEEPQDGLLTITVRSQDRVDVMCRVRPSTPWHQVANAWCARNGVDPVDVRFVFERDRCHPDDTIEQLGLEDGDVVYAMLVQFGD